MLSLALVLATVGDGDWLAEIAVEYDGAQVVLHSGVTEAAIIYDMLEIRDSGQLLIARVYRSGDVVRLQPRILATSEPSWDFAMKAMLHHDAVVSESRDGRQFALRWSSRRIEYVERDTACLLHYPHGCLIEAPWRTSQFRFEAHRK